MYTWFVKWLPAEYLQIPEIQIAIGLVTLFVGAFCALYIIDTLFWGIKQILGRRSDR